MEYLSEDHAKLLLTKEWLVKTDSETSTPYLLKFYSSTIDLNCFVLITDTKSVWGEVLSSNQIARRWRDSNPENSTSIADEDVEEPRRIKCLELLSAAHSLGGVAELSFEPIKSNYSDFAFTLSSDSFRWRWETFSLGPRMSADVLSKHLILPLISMTHLAFSSADPLGTTSETDLEKSVDKIGRTARRTLDTHIRNALSRSLLATTLRRITAMFNFVPDLPRIVAASDTPDLTAPSPPAKSRVPPALKPPLRRALSSSPPTQQERSSSQASLRKRPYQTANRAQPLRDEDSVTEEEEPEEEDYGSTEGKGKGPMQDRRNANARDNSPTRSVPSKRPTPDRPDSPPPESQSPHPPSSSPLPMPKKAKRAKAAESSSGEDSEEERRRHLARLKGTGAVRGTKQPLKRGGRRF